MRAFAVLEEARDFLHNLYRYESNLETRKRYGDAFDHVEQAIQALRGPE